MPPALETESDGYSAKLLVTGGHGGRAAAVVREVVGGTISGVPTRAPSLVVCRPQQPAHTDRGHAIQ